MQREATKQPSSADARLIYAHLLRVQGDWIAAYGEATEAVKLAPQSPYAHALRSTVCYHAQLVSCASREAALFVEIRPNDAAAYIVFGHAKEMQGNHQEASRAYARAEKLDPDYSAIYAGMGAVHFHQGQFAEAVRAYERAIKIDANMTDYYCELAQVYLSEGYTWNAIQQLQRAKELAPYRIEVSFALGNAYLAGERYSSAIKEYRELLDQDPDLLAAREQLAKALHAEGRVEEAAQALQP
jgi:tetratricopeptide (TPR) repeat protein